MMTSIQKVSLFYLAVCVAISTAAFGVMTNGNAANLASSGDPAHRTIADLLPMAQSTVDAVPMAITPPPTPMQKASDAFQSGEQARLANQASVALAHYQTALDISQNEGHRQYAGMIWQRIAKTYSAAQDYQQAEIHYKTAIALAQETDDLVVLGEAQTGLAQVYETQGDPKRALPLYRQALVNLRAVGDQLTAQQVLQQTEKITLALKPATKVAKNSPKAVPSKAAQGKAAKSKTIVAQKPLSPAAAKLKPSKLAAHPAASIKVAIEPESIVQPPERITPPVQATTLLVDNADLDPQPPMVEMVDTIGSPVN